MKKKSNQTLWNDLVKRWSEGKSNRDEREELLRMSKDFSLELEDLRSSLPSAYKQLEWQAKESSLHLYRPLKHHQKQYYRWKLPDGLPNPLVTGSDYELYKCLRSGSLGSKTYLSIHPEDGYLCLYKQYTPSKFGLSCERMFAHQEAIIQRLHDITNPNIEEVIDHFVEGEHYVQIKPYLSGVSFWDWLLSATENEFRLQMIQQVGKSLQTLHENGICHMDFKPDQVFILVDPTTGVIEDKPDFVLLDYDFSMIDGDITLPVGSAPYYAPEQFSQFAPEGHSSGEKVDVYAFAVFVHKLLTEVYPFGDGSTKPTHLLQMKERKNFLSLWVPFSPLKRALRKALHPNPEKRWSLAQLLEVLVEQKLEEHIRNRREEWEEKPSMLKKYGLPFLATTTLQTVAAFFIFHYFRWKGLGMFLVLGGILPLVLLFLVLKYKRHW